MFRLRLFVLYCLFFFFKQKTAYEMRISDWSSDVCSSDLPTKVESAGRIEIGSRDFLIVQGLSNIPLASNAALRVTGAYNRQPDVMKNLADGTSVSIREASIRGRLLWEPSPDVALNLIADHDYLSKKGDVSYVVYFATP